jgi:hypothetical protein
LLFIAFTREGAETGDELLEVYIATAVFVENGYQSDVTRQSDLLADSMKQKEADLVARGFEAICGRLRNSSRSIVPELSLSGESATTLA